MSNPTALAGDQRVPRPRRGSVYRGDADGARQLLAPDELKGRRAEHWLHFRARAAA